MSDATPVAVFQWVFAGLTLCLVIRLAFYRSIPELEATASARPGLLRVDRLLPEFYDSRFVDIRYT